MKDEKSKMQKKSCVFLSIGFIVLKQILGVKKDSNDI